MQLVLAVVDLAICLLLVRNDPACLKGPLGILLAGLVVSILPPLLALRLVVPEEE